MSSHASSSAGTSPCSSTSTSPSYSSTSFTTQTSTPPRTTRPLSFLPSPVLDHASAGLVAGCIATLFTHPLDLLRTRFQVSSTPIRGGSGRAIWSALVDTKRRDGWTGLYRGLGPNVVGNITGWGLYFMWYELLKRRIAKRDPASVHVTPNGGHEIRLSPGGYLLASAEASACTAVMTNPLWVVRVRIFASRPGDPHDYGSLHRGVYEIARTEGIRGLYKGGTFALIGISNSALQFMAYEQLKHIGFEWKRRRHERQGRPWREGQEKLSNIEYIIMSATSKLTALSITYPHQVIRARLQSHNPLYPNIPTIIRLTYKQSGMRGFYRGLATNMIRVLPATCITFVVYENVAWALRRWGREGGVVWRHEEDGEG
ncbi:mitochondrial carrier [Dacryopinax primogenitus]|uniref:Mitochondrial carrier n=1 Tax=Dacryopinax primogenitus (strain DJM 731) TaxID=1858805 RepID=M5GGU2_DACPD|nr:mitochondrial carrier [Dacryopinax primogenitus]EJU06083.1 mitochondrial carrier [Dacryopinax primogenitus]